MPQKPNFIYINFSKCSESFPDITLCGEVVKKVQSTKLLGVYLSDDLKWDCHVEKIHEKAAKRLYQLRILKRDGVASDTLVKVYCANVRPVLEYACPVWHTNLTNIQSQLLETVQKRAFKIVHQRVATPLLSRTVTYQLYIAEENNCVSPISRTYLIQQTK